MRLVIVTTVVAALTACVGPLEAGPYTEPGVAGYVDGDGRPADAPRDPNAPGASELNPIFRGWATAVIEYAPSDSEWVPTHVGWDEPSDTLGPPTGSVGDVASLGDLDAAEIAAGVAPGQLTLSFGDPCDPNDLSQTAHAIRNGAGYDFAVFENGFYQVDQSNGVATGLMLAELAHVEVSSDGVHFARFPSVSLTEPPIGDAAYRAIDISNVYNLAGKHPNGYTACYGTPFDLAELADHPDVTAGRVDLDNIRYVRLVDVPGSGDFYDNAIGLADPATTPAYTNYTETHPIYDQYWTWGSGGADIEAVGVLHEQQYAADIDLNGIVDLFDLAILAHAWVTQWGVDAHYAVRADIVKGAGHRVDQVDLAVLAQQWLQRELWRNSF